MLSARGRLIGASVVCWSEGPSCCGLLLLRPLNTARPAPCLVVCLIVNTLLRWVSYAIASIILPGAASASSFPPTALSYMVKALVIKTLRY